MNNPGQGSLVLYQPNKELFYSSGYLATTTVSYAVRAMNSYAACLTYYCASPSARRNTGAYVPRHTHHMLYIM